MKTGTFIFGNKQITKTLIASFVFVFTLCFNTVEAQETATSQGITVKGKVSHNEEPLSGVNIILQGQKIGATTNEKGEFTFPAKVNVGDVLLFSYLGYETQKFKIEASTTFIDLQMQPDVVEIIGAPNSDKVYKSKRSN